MRGHFASAAGRKLERIDKAIRKGEHQEAALWAKEAEEARASRMAPAQA
jgi:hypothetical protein